MNRSLTAAMQTAVASNELKTGRLLWMNFDGGAEYRTTCYKQLIFDSNTYLPSNILSIGDVQESLELRVPTLSVVLTGVNQANISTALTEDAVDREVVVWRFFLDANEGLIADPVEEFRGTIDSYSVNENPDAGSSILEWSCVSHLADFERIGGRRTNDDEQQLHFAGDKGFEFAALTALDIKWGRA